MSKRPRRLPLAAEYHDGRVEAIEIGPRREVEFLVRLNPVLNGGDGSTRRLRFSAIRNFDEVTAFLRRATRPRPDAFLDEIVGVITPSKGVIGIDLAHLGYIELRGAKVREA